MTRWFLLLAALAVLSSAACGSRAPAGSGDPLYRKSEPVSSPALGYLPRDVRMVLVASSMKNLQRKLDWDALAQRHRGLYERAVAEIVQLTGADLLQPEGMAEVGLDPSGAWGVALMRGDSGALFAPVRDQRRLKTTLYNTASKLDVELDTEVVAQSLLIRPRGDDDWQVVVREQTAFWVIGDDDDVAQTARRVAELGRADSLAGDARYADTMADLGFGADLAGFVSAELVLGDLFGVLGGALFGAQGIGDVPVVFGMELTPTALLVKARLAVEETALVRDVVRDRDRAPAILSALTHEPLMLLAGHVDAGAVAGAPWARELNTPFGLLGVDFVEEVAPLLAGDMGVALVRTGALDIGDRDIASNLGLEVAVELADVDAARALLARVMTESPLAGQVRAGTDAAGDPTYTLADAGWKDVQVGIRGSYLYVTSEPGFAERLGAAHEAPVSADSGLSGALATLLTTPRGAVWASLDAELIGLALMPMHMSYSMPNPSPASPVKDDVASEEYRRKERELEEAHRALWRAEAGMMKAESRRQLELIAAFGDSGVRAEVDERGLVMYGGQFLGEDGLARALDGLIDRVAGRQGEPTGEAYQAWKRARDKEWKLRQELEALHKRDLERYEREQREAEVQAVQGDELGAQVRGHLDKGAIRGVIRKNRGRIKTCYEKALVETPDLKGKLVIDFLISPTGAVESATVAKGLDERVDQCVRRQVKRMQFPRPKGGGVVRVKYPFVFNAAP